MLDTRGMTGDAAHTYCRSNFGFGLPCPDPYEVDPDFDCRTAECIMCCAAHSQGRDTAPTLHALMLAALHHAQYQLEQWNGFAPDDEDTERVLTEVNAAIDAAEKGGSL